MKNLMRLSFLFVLGLFFNANIYAQAADAVVSKESTVMAKSLELSPEQTTKVETVFTAFQKKQSVIESSSKDEKVVGAKLEELDASFAKQLAGILTPEQFGKWQAMQPQG